MLKNFVYDNSVLGFEREFLIELDAYLKAEGHKGFILDLAWEYMHFYISNYYRHGEEYMPEASEYIKEYGYKLKGYDDRTNIEYYIGDIIEDNAFYITRNVLMYIGEKAIDRLEYGDNEFTGNLLEIVEQAAEFYDDKKLEELADVVCTQIKKNIEEVA